MIGGTGAREADDELRRCQAMATAVLEAASQAIVVVGPDGRIRVANASAERLFGYPRHELEGQPVELLVPEHLREAHRGHRAGFLGGPARRAMGEARDLVARRKDGTLIPVDVSLSAVDHERERLAIAFIADATERRQLEGDYQRHRETLDRAERLASLGTLAAGLAHEINNPIGVIASRIELMLTGEEGTRLPPHVREDLQVIQRSVARVARIAHGLLSFAHQSPRDRGPVALDRVVQETMLLVGRQLARAGTEVHVKLEPGLPLIFGDADALQQVVLNLVANAREALGPGGSITVETRRAPEAPSSVELVVSDSGPGIAPEIMARLFDPFFTTKPQGTGLGLPVTYGIVRDHGGVIDVRSEPGQGATFVVRLPATPDPG